MNKNKIIIDNTISLGIDYSYEEIGFCITQDNKILHVSCLNFKKIEKKKKVKITKHLKRLMITKYIQKLYNDYTFTCVIVEQIRVFSRGFLSLPAIIAFAQLILTIYNATYPVPVYSVDTRVWKKRMNGSAKAQKEDTVKWAKQFMTIEIMTKRLWKELTHNEADSIALSLFARHSDATQFLKEEE